MQTFEVECVDRHDAKPYTVRVSADSPEQAAERAAQVHVVAGVKGHKVSEVSERSVEAAERSAAAMEALVDLSREQAATLRAVQAELEAVKKSAALIGSRVRARALAPAIVLGLVIAVPVLFFIYAVALRPS